MRIAFVHPSLTAIGGAEYVTVWLCNELARRGHKISLFVSRYVDELFGRREKQSFSVEEISGPGYGDTSILSVLAQASRLARRSSEFDVMVAHNWPAYPWVAVASFLNKNHPPTIWYCEEPQRALYADICYRPEFRARDLPFRTRAVHAFLRLVDKTLVRSFDLILTNSAFTAGWIDRIFGDSIAAKPCPLGLPLSSQTQDKRIEGKRILTVSRLYPVKNVSTILKAIQILATRFGLTGLEYTIVGDGPDLDRLREATTALGLTKIVTFRGSVSRDSIWSLYEQSTIFVSLPYDEPFGLTFIEAAASGTPSVAPDHGGPSEVVLNGKTGLLADAGSPDAIAACIAGLLQEPALAKKMGESARDHYLEHYTLEKFADRFEQAIDGIAL